MPNDSATTTIRPDELTAFVERKERLAAEAKDIAEAKKELNAEIKSSGYDTKWVDHLVKERAKESHARAEEEALRDMYEDAVGLK